MSPTVDCTIDVHNEQSRSGRRRGTTLAILIILDFENVLTASQVGSEVKQVMECRTNLLV